MTKKSITHFHTIFFILLFSLSSVAMNMNNQTISYAVNYSDDRTDDLHYYYYYIITRQQSVKENGTTRWFKKWMDATHAWFLIEFLFFFTFPPAFPSQKKGKSHNQKYNIHLSNSRLLHSLHSKAPLKFLPFVLIVSPRKKISNKYIDFLIHFQFIVIL